MPNTDSLRTPIEINLDPSTREVISTLRRQLETQLSNIAVKMVGGQIPTGKATVTGRQRFEEGGKQFEVTSGLKLKTTPEQLLSAEGELDVAKFIQFSSTIREVKDKLNKSIDLSSKRLQDFKKSIQFQPFEVKQQSIREFLTAFDLLSESVTNKLPTRQLKTIRSFIERSSTFSPQIRDQFLKEFEQFSKSLSTVSFEERVKKINEYVQRFGDQNNELKSRLDKITATINRQQFRKIKLENVDLPIDERIKVFQKYADDGKIFADEAKAEISRLRALQSKQQFQKLKLSTQQLPVQERIKAYQAFIDAGTQFEQQLRNEIIKLQRQVQKDSLRTLRIRIAELPTEERIKAYQAFIDAGTPFEQEVKNSIQKLKRQTGRESFRQLKLRTAELPTQERIKAYQDFIDAGTPFELEIRNQIKKLQNQARRDKDRLSGKNFRQLKFDLSQKPLETQIKGYQDYIAAGGEFVDQANAQIRKLSKQFVDSAKNLRRQRFTDFTKRLQTLEPQQAIQELDSYLNKTTAVFAQDAKVIRERLRRQIENSKAQQQRERTRNFSNNTLVASGIGLGLLGTAGFPLLNVGFAAMSGGPIGAALVGTATAIGETIRAFNRFRESTISVAREIGFVSTAFKNAEARMKAVDAFLASGSLTAQRVGSEERFKALVESGQGIRGLNTEFTNAIEALKTRFTKFTTGADSISPIEFLGGPLTRQVRGLLEDFFEQREKTDKGLLPDLLSAQRNFNLQIAKPTVGIETDPFQSWLRIQTSAFDPSKQIEIEQQREMVKALNELVKIAKEREKKRAEEESKKPSALESISTLGIF